MTHAADVRIGTSGWHYHHWIGPFYPPATRPEGFLEHYARHFSTVEINNTFYRLPTRHAVLQWRDGSPSGFVFATKGNRFITHMETSNYRIFEEVEVARSGRTRDEGRKRSSVAVGRGGRRPMPW
jgi:uncharacterized protein YecE (DUF72 family)